MTPEELADLIENQFRPYKEAKCMPNSMLSTRMSEPMQKHQIYKQQLITKHNQSYNTSYMFSVFPLFSKHLQSVHDPISRWRKKSVMTCTAKKRRRMRRRKGKRKPRIVVHSAVTLSYLAAHGPMGFLGNSKTMIQDSGFRVRR